MFLLYVSCLINDDDYAYVFESAVWFLCLCNLSQLMSVFSAGCFNAAT